MPKLSVQYMREGEDNMNITLRCADLNIEMSVVFIQSDGKPYCEIGAGRSPFQKPAKNDGRLWQCARFEFTGVKERLYAGRWFTGQKDKWPKVIDIPGKTLEQLRAMLNSHQVPEIIEELASEWSNGGLTSWA